MNKDVACTNNKHVQHDLARRKLHWESLTMSTWVKRMHYVCDLNKGGDKVRVTNFSFQMVKRVHSVCDLTKGEVKVRVTNFSFQLVDAIKRCLKSAGMFLRPSLAPLLF